LIFIECLRGERERKRGKEREREGKRGKERERD
jgi:hypothetical protein